MKMAVALYMIDAIKEIVCVRWLCMVCVVFRFWLESCSSCVMIVVVALIFLLRYRRKEDNRGKRGLTGCHPDFRVPSSRFQFP